MRVLFDTSVLVAALVVNHSQHNVCLPWLENAKTSQIQGLISTHSLAELYSVLTRLPYQPPISHTLAQQLILENLQNFEKVPLTEADYHTAIAQMVDLRIAGGGVFDALIAQAALKANANTLLTLNARHFIRLGDAIAALTRIPE